ncbi:Flagellar biosynthesis protein FliQ [hydrothermal vent metagenome]|uniref:Flagellar biosynthesis protein FliQ n=1 Tax=hydrothermal vent metagenome TaxID=652676 RepID=A0A3B1A1B2_9ZZZZ
MTPETIVSIGQNALYVTMLVLGVLLLPALVVGLLVSMFQAATQINEMTLSFIPKLMVTFLALVIGGPWILEQLLGFMREMFKNVPYLIG